MIGHRSTKKRRLERSGLRHAAGWIRKEREPEFDEMVEEAKEDVERVTKDD